MGADIAAAARLALFDRASSFGLMSGWFVLAFTLFLGVYAWVGTTAQRRIAALLAFSLLFYVRASGLFVGLLVASTLLDHIIALRLAASESVSRRRWLFVGIACNLAMLVVFRYSPLWAMVQARTGSGWFGMAWSAIPVGVSFFTFQKIGYLVDVHRRQVQPAPDWRHTLLFVSFFPRLLSGPIVRATSFFPQLVNLDLPASGAVRNALPLLLSGIVKKALIADYIGVNFVDRVFAAPGLYSGTEALLAVYGYAFQIYCDFSGYTDLALGVALLVGIQLPKNFDAPYRSRSVTEFWRRWHITLSEWLRDYVFLPLAYVLSRRITSDRVWGVRADLWIYGTAALVTWLLCGLWHGAGVGFLLWGLIHGTAVTLEKVTRWPQKMNKTRLRQVVARVVTFHVVCLAWVFFRAEDLVTAWSLLDQIAFSFHPDLTVQIARGYPLVVTLIGLAAVFHFVSDTRWDRVRQWMGRWTPLSQSLALAMAMWLVLQIRSADLQAFIYFRF